MAFARERHGIDNFIYFEPQIDIYTAEGGFGFAHAKAALGWGGVAYGRAY